MWWPQSFGQWTGPAEFPGGNSGGLARLDRWNSLCSLVILPGRCRSDRSFQWAWLCCCHSNQYTETNRIGPTRLDELGTGTVVAICADNDRRCGAAGWSAASGCRCGLSGRDRKRPDFCGNDAIRTPARWLVWSLELVFVRSAGLRFCAGGRHLCLDVEQAMNQDRIWNSGSAHHLVFQSSHDKPGCVMVGNWYGCRPDVAQHGSR